MPAENEIFSRGTYFLTLDCSPAWITFDYRNATENMLRRENSLFKSLV